MTEAPADGILDDLFHGFAFAAYVEIANACRSVPDSEAVRRLAYRRDRVAPCRLTAPRPPRYG